MCKDKKVIGIDVSKDKIDVYKLGVSNVYSNDKQGFKQLKKELICQSSHCVMEVTGAYHQLLVMYLYSSGVLVSVVNPLIVKRFIQMNLHHNKTDKSDAKQIARYGEQHELTLWSPPSEYVTQCKLIYACINQYNKQSTALKNKLHSLASQGISTGALVRSVKRQIKHLKEEKLKLEQELEKLVNEHESELYTHLKSISGAMAKTAEASKSRKVEGITYWPSTTTAMCA
jgi:transposase